MKDSCPLNACLTLSKWNTRWIITRFADFSESSLEFLQDSDFAPAPTTAE